MLLSESTDTVALFIKMHGLDAVNKNLNNYAETERITLLLWLLSNIAADDEDHIYALLQHQDLVDKVLHLMTFQ